MVIFYPANPFIQSAIPPLPTTAPIVPDEVSSQLSYMLSPPENLELDYNSEDGSGNISWNASRWMPIEPSLESTIEYEIYVHYPDNRMGPYRTDATSYHFDYLNAHSTGGVRIEVAAVGTVHDGQKKLHYTADAVETVWTATAN